MDKHELKKKLHSYRDLLAEYEQIKMELEKVEAFMTAPRGSNLDGMPRNPGGGDAILGVVSHHITLQTKYKAQLVKLAAAQDEIENLIDGLEPGERRLMRCRYIDGMTWEEVCVRIGYSWRQTHNIHSRILEKLAESLDKPRTPKHEQEQDPCAGCYGVDCHHCRYGDDY